MAGARARYLAAVCARHPDATRFLDELFVARDGRLILYPDGGAAIGIELTPAIAAPHIAEEVLALEGRDHAAPYATELAVENLQLGPEAVEDPLRALPGREVLPVTPDEHGSVYVGGGHNPIDVRRLRFTGDAGELRVVVEGVVDFTYDGPATLGTYDFVLETPLTVERIPQPPPSRLRRHWLGALRRN